MTKKNATETPADDKKSTALAHYDYGEDAGKGFEGTSQADYAIPFLNLLQQNSPECTDGDPKRVPGAVAGMFMDSVSKRLFDGQQGVFLVPCCTQRVYAEWVPRLQGGGFIGLHQPGTELVQRITGGKATFGKLRIPTGQKDPQGNEVLGNELIETFYMFCLVLESADAKEPLGMAVVAFTSTKIKKYKAIMTQLRTFSSKVPLFAHRLRATSIQDRNKQNQPFKNLELKPALGDVRSSLIEPMLDGAAHPLMTAAKALIESVGSGKARVAHNTQGNDGGGGEDEGGDQVFA